MEVSSSLLVEMMFVMILSIRIGSRFFGRFWLDGRLVEAQKKFRRVQGWRDIEKLVTVLTDLEAKEEAAAERVA
jgi:hypothetical protein